MIYAGLICFWLSLLNGLVLLFISAEKNISSETFQKARFSSWFDSMFCSFFSLQAHHLLLSTWFQMSMRLLWTWNGAVLRTRVAARTFPTMSCARSVERVTLASADPVEVGFTTPHSRTAWRPPRSPSLTSWLIPTTRLKSGQWMVCPSITLAQTNPCPSLWPPTKPVGITSTLL